MFQQEALIELMLSLSKAEKRYFTMHSRVYNNKEHKKYLLLFRKLEKELPSKRSGRKGRLQPSSLSEASIEKYHLYNQVTESLVNFYKNDSSLVVVINNLKLADVFIYKGLTGLALKLITRTKNICYRYELYEMLLAVLRKEIAVSDHHANLNLGRQQEIVDEYAGIITLINEINYIDSVRLRISSLFREKGTPRTTVEIEMYEEMVSPLLTGKFLQHESVTVRDHLYRLLASYYHVREQYDKAYEYYRLRFQLFSAFKDLLMKDKKSYIIFLAFFAQNCISLGKDTETNEIIRLLEATGEEGRIRNHMIEREVEKRLIPLQLYYFGTKKQYSRITDIAGQVELFLNKYAGELPQYRKHAIIYNMCQTFFIMGDLKGVITWAGKAGREKNAGREYDTYYFLKLLQAIAFYELGDHDMADSIIASLKRYVHNRKEQVDCFDLDMLRLLYNLNRQAATGFTWFIKKYNRELKELLKEHAAIKHWLEQHYAYPLKKDISQ